MATRPTKEKPLLLATVTRNQALSVGFRVFLRSYASLCAGRYELRILAGHMSDQPRRLAENCGAEIEISSAMRNSEEREQRYFDYARWLNSAAEATPGRLVMTLDASSTVVQHHDLFADVQGRETTYLAATGGLVHQDTKLMAEVGKYQDRVRDSLLLDTYERAPALADDFAAGTARRMAHYAALRLALDFTGSCGRASLTAYVYTTRRWFGFKLVEPTTPWVGHGNWYETTKHSLLDDNFQLLCKQTGSPYPLFHQWDRTPAFDYLQEKFGKRCS